jgi:tRNA pseudouridine13 synthase
MISRIRSGAIKSHFCKSSLEKHPVMKFKIKSLTEDFIVEEIACLPLVKNGMFGVYLLEKKGWNTSGVLLRVSEELNIPFKYFSYGGKKDRYSSSSQYITVKGKRIPDLKHPDYSLVFRGFMDRPMGPDLIQENKFQVVVRGLRESAVRKAHSALVSVKASGYPNYFDDQRFGSVDLRQGFFAEKILKKHFNGALKIYLTSIYKSESNREKQKKEFLFANWGDWRVCQKGASGGFERKVFDSLVKNPKDFLPLLNQLSRERLSMYFGAYQAHIWNEVLRRVIKKVTVLPLSNYSGVSGDYIFYRDPEEDIRIYLKDLGIPTIAAKFDTSDKLCGVIYDSVMEENGVKKSMFNAIKIRKVYFKSVLRKAVVFPCDVVLAPDNDELNKGMKKLILGFRLPRGSYATMFLKRLFAAS